MSNTVRGLIAWAVALLLPGGLLPVLGVQNVADHPGLAVMVVAAYLVLGGILSFVLGVGRRLSDRAQRFVVDRVTRWLQKRTSNFEGRYRTQVLKHVEAVERQGLRIFENPWPKLNAVFVDLSLAPRFLYEIGASIIPTPAGNQARLRVLGDYLDAEQPTRLAVVGGPGSGKTTLLQHAAGEAARRGRRRRNGGRPARDIPFLLYLRHHADAIIADPLVSPAALLRRALGEGDHHEPPEWFEEKLREGRCLVLLDGLDEVGRPENRLKVSAWAQHQIEVFPGNDFVISSRPRGYQSAALKDATILQVFGLTAEQIRNFVRRWYQEISRLSNQTDSVLTPGEASAQADRLLGLLRMTPALYDLALNPLLLTMIVNMHRLHGKLPGSRTDLYSEICEAMLGRRQDDKGLAEQSWIQGRQKESILRSLAYSMMKAHVLDLNRSNVAQEIASALDRRQYDISPEPLLDDVTTNGLLIEPETGVYSFAHKTFQEYLAASYIIHDDHLVQDLSDAVNDDWWAQTTILYAARAKADPIIEACLESGTPTALALARDCLAEDDSDVDGRLRKRMADLFDSAARPDADPELRQLFAGTLLNQHMRQRERTTGSGQVSIRPVKGEVYRFFLTDKGIPEPDRLLDPPGPAVGMRGDDARKFVDWANDLTGGNPRYRLPRASELDELDANDRVPALRPGQSPTPWTQDGGAETGSLPVLWHAPGTPDPFEIPDTMLAREAARDISGSADTPSGLLLLRARILTRVLALTGKTGGGLDLQAIRDEIREPDFDRLLSLVASNAYSADLSSGGGPGPREAVGFLRGFSLQQTRDLVRDFDLNSVRDQDVDRARGRVGNGSRVGDAALALNLTLDRELTHFVSRDFALREVYAAALTVFRQACRLTMGRAFANAVIDLPPGVGWKDFTARVTQEFTHACGIDGDSRFSADPSALRPTLQAAVRKLTNTTTDEPSGLLAAATWPSALAGQLIRDAGPVFSRAESPTVEKASRIRVAALRLAAETDDTGAEGTGTMFREVAAGITLLRRRAEAADSPDPRDWPREVIMLAVDQPTL